MTGPEWSEIEPLLAGRGHEALVARLAELDDAGRKLLVKPMRDHTRSGEYGLTPTASLYGLTLVGAAVLPDARSTAAWLRRFPSSGWWSHREQHWPGATPPVVEVLVSRNPGWLPGLVRALADRYQLESYPPADFDVIDTLRRAINAPPPLVPFYIAGWARRRWHFRMGDSPSEALRDEPEFAQLVPLLFDEDGIAGNLRSTGDLTDLVDEGLVDRGVLLDAAIARLQRGGRPQATNDFVAVLESLAPSVTEVAARLSDYLALLTPGTASTVAASAQAALIKANAAETVSSADLISASSVVLARDEKKVLRTQLGWLEQHSRNHPEDARSIAAAAAVAASSRAVDVRHRAERLLQSVGQPTVAAPVSLAPTAVGLPRPSHPQPLVAIADLDELVERFLTLLRAGAPNAMEPELVAEAFPRLAGPRGAALREVRHRFAGDVSYEYRRRDIEVGSSDPGRRGIVTIVAALIGDAWEECELAEHSRPIAPHRALTERFLDLARALERDPRTRVVSLPTDSSGSVAPEVLRDRLAAARTGGWDPAPLDLEQAQLRSDPLLHASPTITLVTCVLQANDRLNVWSRDPSAPPNHLTRAEVSPAGDDAAEPTTLWSSMTHLVRDDFKDYWGSEYSDAWPHILPHHPEVVAAHMLPALSRATVTGGRVGEHLLALAESGRPVGPATHAALALALSGRDVYTRSAAVDVLLALVARNHLDEAELGHRLAVMIGQGEVTVQRLPRPLEDAARAGAAPAVWTVLRELLAGLLTQERLPVGMVDLITCAATVAELGVDPLPIPGLDRLTSSAARSHQVVEARRLAAILEE